MFRGPRATALDLERAHQDDRAGGLAGIGRAALALDLHGEGRDVGLMDFEAGRLDRAMTHYQDAERALPGWWLIEEHEAELLALRGESAAAHRRYDDLVRRTGDPEFMDALARLDRRAGRDGDARRWIARAGAVHAARMRRFREAAVGHALSHAIAFEPPAAAIALAERNAALRPNGEAQTLLAEAYMAGGRTGEAARALATARASGWTSAALDRATAEVVAARR